MGTNYYWHNDACVHCRRSDQQKHIGKSSSGWCFSLHVYPEEGIKDLEDWIKLFSTPGSLIKDEYGAVASAEEMLGIIRDRMGNAKRSATGYSSWEYFHRSNYSEFGPNGLIRSKISKESRCISHGEGTWDCIVGEFS